MSMSPEKFIAGPEVGSNSLVLPNVRDGAAMNRGAMLVLNARLAHRPIDQGEHGF
jgi:hypothetical protein